MQLKDILYDNGSAYVIQGKGGKGHFEIYKSGVTHAVRCGIVDYNDAAQAFEVAKQRADRELPTTKQGR